MSLEPLPLELQNSSITNVFLRENWELSRGSILGPAWLHLTGGARMVFRVWYTLELWGT